MARGSATTGRGAVSAVRIREIEEGVEIDVPNDRPCGAIVIESGDGSVRVAIDGRTRLWARVLPCWAGLAWARGDTGPVDAIAPIRAVDARATTRDEAWPRYVAEALFASTRSWLRPGTWAVARLAPRAPGLELAPPGRLGIPSVARDLAAAIDAPASAIDRWWPRGRVLPLRTPSHPDAARVKTWRKHARDGTLPPIVLGWVGPLNAWLVLDGHDRLLAAKLEHDRLPDALGVFGVRDDTVTWSDADRDRARADALARYERVFAAEDRLSPRTRLEANDRLAGAWSDYLRRRSWTPATYRPGLADRFARELASRDLPDEVRTALLA